MLILKLMADVKVEPSAFFLCWRWERPFFAEKHEVGPPSKISPIHSIADSHSGRKSLYPPKGTFHRRSVKAAAILYVPRMYFSIDSSDDGHRMSDVDFGFQHEKFRSRHVMRYSHIVLSNVELRGLITIFHFPNLMIVLLLFVARMPNARLGGEKKTGC